jgi:two-component system cell cycle sensor histidine kinase/response regulator CckA
MLCGSRARSNTNCLIFASAAGLLACLLVAAFISEPMGLQISLGLAGFFGGGLFYFNLRERNARHRAEDRSEQLADLIEASGKALVGVSRDGRVAFASKRVGKLFGDEEIPVAKLATRVADDEHSAREIARLSTLAAAGGAGRCELTAHAPNGEMAILEVEVRQTPWGVAWTAKEVTADRAISHALLYGQSFLADMLDDAPVGLFAINEKFCLTYANLRLAQWLGLDPGQLIGHPLSDFLAAGSENLHMAAGERGEVWWHNARGENFRAILLRGQEGHSWATFRPLSAESAAEQNHSAGGWRWLFDDAPVGIATLDADGALVAANRNFREMIGLSASELSERALTDLASVDDRDSLLAALRRLIRPNSQPERLDMALKGEREFPATLFLSPIRDHDGDGGHGREASVLHVIDVSERKSLEQQFAQAQKMQAMGQLAGGVAHDFNNLLTAMLGFCDLLLQRHKAGDPSFADIMQVKQNANRAANLVRQLLAFSRRQALQPRLIDVTDALTELSHLLRRLMGERIELRFEHGRDLGLIRVDPGQFDQVVINLAVNARDAMPGGGVLSIRTAAVSLSEPLERGHDTVPSGDYVVIEVADTGVGIDRDTLRRIFEPFFSTKSVGEGTGLGLSTVYGILRQTDGYVIVDSAPGEGTSFTIYLPRHRAAPRPMTAPGAEEKKPIIEAKTDLTGVGTILLVEDEDAVRMFAARALKGKGYRVLEARNGEGALDILNAEAIDLMVSDIVMPGMDGATLARFLRVEKPEIPIILMSGYNEEMGRGDFDADPNISFIAKPFSLSDLAALVKSVIEKRQE